MRFSGWATFERKAMSSVAKGMRYKERTTLLKLFVGTAIAGYGYNPPRPTA
jgi:hypothetical protein